MQGGYLMLFRGLIFAIIIVIIAFASFFKGVYEAGINIENKCLTKHEFTIGNTVFKCFPVDKQ